MTNRTFLFFLVKKTVVSSLSAVSLMDLQSSLSFITDLMRNKREIEACTRARWYHPLTFALSHVDKQLSCLFFRHSLLPNLFFSSSLSLFPFLFHNFIGHVLDSVNKCIVSRRLPLVWCDGTCGLPEERWRSSRLYQRTYIKAGLHHIIREGNVYPTKRPGDHESQKATKVAPTVLRSRGHGHYPTVFYTAC